MPILFVLVMALIFLGLGWRIVSRLDSANVLSNGERLVVSYLIGCLIIYLGVFAVGLYRLDGPSMWALVTVSALLSVPGLMQIPWNTFIDAAGRELQLSRQERWLGGLWLAVLAVGLSALIQGMAPPNDYDSLMYHLTQPQYDVELGKISIPWDRALGTELFPALAGNLSRLALAISGSGSAQMLHGMLGLIAALGSGMLALRVGFGKRGALGAALFFLATRVVIWEMGTVEVDVPLASYLIGALIVYQTLRTKPQFGIALLFGLLVGSGILTKYHGFIVAAAFAPVILWDLSRKQLPLSVAIVGSVTALITLMPHMVRNFWITGNPIFPIFNTIFIPEKHNFFNAGAAYQDGGYGTGRGIFDLLITPWNMFVYPMQVFDGMIFGAPYLFAFAPLILLAPAHAKKCLPALSVAVFYFLGWFYLLDFQVRFLLPIVPVLSVVAVGGVISFWTLSEQNKLLKAAFAGLGLVLGLNQLMFVGIYSVIRLPAAVGLISPEYFHSKTPTMNGANYGTCSYIRDHIKAGETYFSILQPHSYYCPQASVVHVYFPDESQWWNEVKDRPSELPLSEFIRRAEQAQFRYFIAPVRTYNRRNDTAKMIIKKATLSGARFGQYLRPVFETLTPLKEGPYTGVYDGPQVINGLKELLATQTQPPATD